MKTILQVIFFILFIATKLISQNNICVEGESLDIIILDQFGFVKTSNFCENELVTLKVDGNYDRYIWGINNNESDQNRQFFYDKSIQIRLPNYQAHINLSAYKKGNNCYSKGSKFINNFLTTKRSLIIADSAFVGEEIVISTNNSFSDDILYTPFDTIFNFSGFRKESFQASKEGTYRLVNERINNICGIQDKEKNLYLTNNTAPTTIEIIGPPNSSHCEGWLMEIGLKTKNLKIKNPAYIVYLSDSPTFIKDSYYEQLAAVNNDNGFIMRPLNNISGKYIFIREQLSGVYSNVIGPIKYVQKSETEKHFDVNKYPQTLISIGETTEYDIKSTVNGKLFWLDQFNIINTNTSVLKIENSGDYRPIYTYAGECSQPKNWNPEIKVTIFESIIPNIKVSTSCEKQAHIELILDNNSRSKGLVKIKWKKDGKIIKETEDFGLLATEFGNYQCEVWYKDKMIESNILQIKKFENYQNRVDMITMPEANNPCKVSVLALYNYYNYSLFDTKFQWFVNDTLQLFTGEKFEYPSEKLKNSVKVRVVLKEGLCEYNSITQVIGNNYNFFYNLPTEYEFCEGNIVNIVREGNGLVGNYKIKNDWYLNDEYLYSNLTEGAFQFGVSLNASKSGNYQLVNTFYNDKNEALCVNKSEPFEVKFKKEITLPESALYLKELCPTIPKLNLQLTKNDLEGFEWQYNGNKNLNFQTLSQPDIESQIETIYMQSPGSYQGVAKYKNGCIAKTQPYEYDGNHYFDLEKGFNKSNKYFCSNEYIIPKNDWDNQFIKFNYIWKVNDETIPNETNPGITPKISGVYEAFVRHDAGNCILKSRPFKVEMPNINKALNFIDTTYFCEGSTRQIALNDSTNKLIHWYIEENPFANTVKFEASKVGNYQALFSNKFCPNDYYFSNTLKVTEIAKPTATISGSKTFNYSQSADLKIELTSAPPWQVTLSTGEDFTIEKSPFAFTVRPLADTKYTISSVKNTCGLGLVSGDAIIRVIVLGDELDQSEATINVFPNPTNDAINIEFPENTLGNSKIELIDILGKIIKKQTIVHSNKNFKQLNISELPAGIYQLYIISNHKTYRRKIIKE